MGIIQKQAVRGTVYAYLGVALGFFTTVLILPRLFSTAENGLLKLLDAYASLFGRMATLGFVTVTARSFPYFRDIKNKHNGFFFLSLSVIVLGSLLFFLFFGLLKPVIIRHSIDESGLFAQYIHFLLPLTFFWIIFSIIDRIYISLYNATIGLFLMDFLRRLVLLVVLIVYFIGWLTFHQTIIAYSISYCLPGLLIIILLWRTGEFDLKPRLSFIDRKLARQMANLALYGFFSGLGAVVVLQIDSIMVSTMLGLSATGIYAITFFFGVVIKIPSRPVIKITSTFFAEAWKVDDRQKINEIYRKTSLNQFVIACFLFIGIWANIDNILEILPPEYAPGKYVIFFIGLASVVEMLSGNNNSIISTSHYFRYISLFVGIFIVSLILFNYIFINLWGLKGAAVASVSAVSLNLVARVWFLYRRFNFQPFIKQHIYTLLIALSVYALVYLLPAMPHFVLDILLRTALLTCLFGGAILLFRVSDEINHRVFVYYQTARRVLRKFLKR